MKPRLIAQAYTTLEVSSRGIIKVQIQPQGAFKSVSGPVHAVLGHHGHRLATKMSKVSDNFQQPGLIAT